ncbi:MAG: DUF4974 domain-containing protein [Tannerellaceae bacterium]|nr:DUF4974 domain-containing protein [Tannerellaceae bacterium]
MSAYSDQYFITTTLKEGAVEVHIEDKSIRIEPNEQLSYNRKSGQLIRKMVDGDYIAAWRQGDLIFLRATMDEIIRTLEHRYNVNMYLNSNYYEGEIITAKFIHGEDLNEALGVLKQLIPGFSYQIVENKDGKDTRKKVFIR